MARERQCPGLSPLRGFRGQPTPVPSAQTPDALDSDFGRSGCRVLSLLDEREAKVMWDPPTCHVRSIVMNLDELDLGHRERRSDQAAGGLCGDPSTGSARPRPVSDLESGRTDASVEAASANERVRLEHPEMELLTSIPAVEPVSDEVLAIRKLKRLGRNPGHPRSEVIEALDDRLVQAESVGQGVPTQNPPRSSNFDGRTTGRHLDIMSSVCHGVHSSAPYRRDGATVTATAFLSHPAITVPGRARSGSTPH
jgi:hypothetical protein